MPSWLWPRAVLQGERLSGLHPDGFRFGLVAGTEREDAARSGRHGELRVVVVFFERLGGAHEGLRIADRRRDLRGAGAARRDLHFGRACVVGFVRAFGFGIAVGDRDRVAAFGEGVGGLLGVIRRDRRPAFVEIFTPDAEREIFAVGFCRSAGRALNRGHRRSGINRGVGFAGDADGSAALSGRGLFLFGASSGHDSRRCKQVKQFSHGGYSLTMDTLMLSR